MGFVLAQIMTSARWTGLRAFSLRYMSKGDNLSFTMFFSLRLPGPRDGRGARKKPGRSAALCRPEERPNLAAHPMVIVSRVTGMAVRASAHKGLELYDAAHQRVDVNRLSSVAGRCP